MGRYYFNVRRDDTVFEDHRGAVLRDVAEAWRWALKDGLALVRDGFIDPATHRCWIEICDDRHCTVMAFPMGRMTLQ